MKITHKQNIEELFPIDTKTEVVTKSEKPQIDKKLLKEITQERAEIMLNRKYNQSFHSK